MAAGEEYLAHLGEPESSSSVVSKRKKVKKKATTNKSKGSKSKTKTITKKKNGTDKPAKKTGGAGQKEAVMNLVNSGFFDSGKTGPEVQAHLKNKRGLNFTIEQLLVVMLRLLRDNVLDRDENTDGQYEYTKPKS